MNIGKLPSSSSSIIDKSDNPISDSNVTCALQVEKEHEDEVAHPDDENEEEEGQVFYSVASDQSSSPENSTRTQVKDLEGEDTNQLSSSPTSGSSVNTSSSALSSYDNSPQNPSLLYSLLFPGIIRRKSSCGKKKGRSSSLRKVSIKENPETFLLNNESDGMSQETMGPEPIDNGNNADIESGGPSSLISSRKTSCSSRKSSTGQGIETLIDPRRESVDEHSVRIRMDSGSSIGSWRKTSTASVELKRDGLKVPRQARKRSETVNYEADNEVRHFS